MKTKERKIVSYLLLIAFSFIVSLHGAWINNIPIEIVQPDGVVINAFASGDEFHNWVHDSSGYTIIQDPESGYWCWARATADGDVISSGYRIDVYNPESLNISPNENISEEKYRQKRNLRDDLSSERDTRMPTNGEVVNLVVFIRFSDQTEFSQQSSFYNNMFNTNNTNSISLHSYFRISSHEQLLIDSPFYPTTTGTGIVSYQSTHPRNYCLPYHATNNPNGYPIVNNDHTEGYRRLHAIFGAALTHISNQIPTTLNIDADNDGAIDNICFVLRGNVDAWANVLWPHRWDLHYSANYINGKRARQYNLNIENDLNSSGVGTIVHEYGHSLGMPDLYRYSGNYNPIGEWDVMAGGIGNPPSSMSAYIRNKYLDWGCSIPTITTSGTYTLSPVTTSLDNSAYKINSPYSQTEYFVVEYRRNNTGLIDNLLPGSGLLVYRVNTLGGNGNVDPPDELYVYRPGGTTSSNGQINNAFFNATVGRTQINDNTNPSSFLSNGQPGGLNISGISTAGTTISFTVTVPEIPMPSNLSGSHNGSAVVLNWNAPSNTNGLTGYNVYRNNRLITRSPITTVTHSDIVVVPGQSYTYALTAVFNTGESAPIEASVTAGAVVTITNFPYSHTFENPTFTSNGWGLLDEDGDAETWWRSTGSGANTGNGYLTSASRNALIGALTPDNWLITPRLALSSATQVRFYVGSTNTSNFAEHYSVLISTTNTAVSSFTTLHSETLSTAQWQERIINLNQYTNQNVFIAFRHHNVTGRAILKLDDIHFEAGNSEESVLPNISTRLLGNYPNPFNPSTTISWQVAGSSGQTVGTKHAVSTNVNITIYNTKGQKVKTLTDDLYPAGKHQITWNGNDDNGNPVSSGVYLYKMSVGDYNSVKKMILMK